MSRPAASAPFFLLLKPCHGREDNHAYGVVGDALRPYSVPLRQVWVRVPRTKTPLRSDQSGQGKPCIATPCRPSRFGSYFFCEKISTALPLDGQHPCLFHRLCRRKQINLKRLSVPLVPLIVQARDGFTWITESGKKKRSGRSLPLGLTSGNRWAASPWSAVPTHREDV